MKSVIILSLILFPFLLMAQLNIVPGIGYSLSEIEISVFAKNQSSDILTGRLNLEYQLSSSWSFGLTSRISKESYSYNTIGKLEDVARFFEIVYLNIGTGAVLNYWMTDDWEINLGYAIDRLPYIEITDLTMLESSLNVNNVSKDVHIMELGITFYASKRTKIFCKSRFRPIKQNDFSERIQDNLLREYYAIDAGVQYKIPIKFNRIFQGKIRGSKDAKIGCPE